MPTLAVIWRAAGLLFATDARAVIEALPPVAWSPAADVPEWIRGLIRHRGSLVPLVDVARLLGESTKPDRMSNRVLIVRCSLDTDSVPCTAGLWVEGILDLERLDVDAAGAHPGFATPVGRFLGSVVTTRWGEVQFLDPKALFTPEQAAVLAERLREAAA